MMGPLEGIKVVELSTWAVVPCVCEIMGDWGADVIKIEHPSGGDPTRGWAGPGWLELDGLQITAVKEAYPWI